MCTCRPTINNKNNENWHITKYRPWGNVTYRRYNSDEELWSIGIWSSISHTESVGTVVLQCGVKLILELTTPYRLTSRASTCVHVWVCVCARMCVIELEQNVVHPHWAVTIRFYSQALTFLVATFPCIQCHPHAWNYYWILYHIIHVLHTCHFLLHVCDMQVKELFEPCGGLSLLNQPAPPICAHTCPHLASHIEYKIHNVL